MRANERLAREYAPTPREVHVHDGEWCVACLAQGGRDALEFATRREPLDVEVLARAWHAVYDRDPAAVRITWETATETERRMWLNHAKFAAAEYARLEAERDAR